MPRQIISAKAAAAPPAPGAPQPPADGYKERFLKYIPAEVITLYTTLTGIVAGASGQGGKGAGAHPSAVWSIFAIGLIATPVYLRLGAKITSTVQITISTIAFIIWAAVLGGPFQLVFDPNELKMWSAIALAVFTFGVAFIEP